MRRTLLLLAVFAASAFAGQLPLTVKEIGLMLRAGYSSKSVAQELARRHFADTLDADKEDALMKAGATPELIESLKAGAFTLSGQSADQARVQLAGQELRNSVQSDRARKANEAYAAQVVRQRNSKILATAPAGPSLIYEAVKDDLVRFNNGAMVRADDGAIANKKYIALYFSAHWCGPCRKFTPELIEYYNRVTAEHPEFEIIFFSADRSAFEMETYMREANMPWPAIDFQKLASKEVLHRYAGSGIPDLVLLDANGKVLSDSFAGTQYLGPQKVLADIENYLGNGNGSAAGAGQVAQAARH